MAAPQDVPDVDNMEQEDENDQAQRIINEEYKVWKKNSPFLYDILMSRALEWPSLTTQWFPDVKWNEDKSSSTHRLLLGTHTSEDKPNYLQIAEITVPKKTEPDPKDYKDDNGEIGGYGSRSQQPVISFEIIQKIEHPEEVNKARYMPQNPDIIATYCVDGRVLIFDRTRHPSVPTGVVNPQLELIGHTKEGFGLSWSPRTEGKLASAGEDTTVKIWNIKDDLKADSRKVEPSHTFTHHKQIVNDVQFHQQNDHLIGTVSDDLTFQIVDDRKPERNVAVLSTNTGHKEAINALAFHPTQEWVVVTGSADRTIAVWDLRMIKHKTHTLIGHQDAVTALSWHPQQESILGSASYDRRVIQWDLNRIGEEQLPDEAEDGPPELLFMHGGHTNHLADFSWNLNEPWLVASAAEDNVLQLWQVSDTIVGRDDGPIPISELTAS